MVSINGKQRHIITYLQDFLFTPDTSRAPIKKLSGGERARLLLARLFLQPANVLVLDEPTNDLDIETVELLEERLLDYDGTLLLVSHDRSFLDNVVTSTIALEGDGIVAEYNGGCEDWLEQYEARKAAEAKAAKAPAPVAKAATPAPVPAKPERKLTNKEREALKTLPALIAKLEAEHTTLSEKMASADYYQDKSSDLSGDASRLEKLEADTMEAYEQWESLTAEG
jgi:ATP-binding cassette subfamily F protein uup